MIGILTEKPSAARNFSEALGGMTGTYNGEQYTIVNSLGHLYEYKKPDKQVEESMVRKYKSWNLSNLPWNEDDFKWVRELKRGTLDTAKNIKAKLSQCEEVIIATDNDPSGEGELLAWEVLEELKLRPKKYSRMFFEDESVKEIQKAFLNRRPIQSMETDMDYVKALFRTKFDYMSMQFTRIATACGDGQSVLRQGRTKSAMVVFVGDALEAIKKYKKIPGYQNRFVDENGVKYFNQEEPVFPQKEQVPNIYQPSQVICDSKTIKHTVPPKMLDIAALSAKLSPLGIKAETVLKVYQKMYEDHILSYPRTEDKYITPEQFNEMLPLVDDIAALIDVDITLLTHRKPRQTHVKTGCAHGANRPGKVVPTSMEALKEKYGPCAPLIYDLLARNYLATLAEDFEYEHQEGHLVNYPQFVGKVNIPRKIGYKAVYIDDDVDENDTGESKTGLGTIAKPFIHELFPPKPPKPTMSWLMKQLEKNDVGTGSTRTSIYADVTNSKTKYPLLIDTKGKITMSEYGKMSYLLLENTHIGDLKITKDMQADMKLISEGKVDPEICLSKMKQMVIDDAHTMQENGKKMRSELNISMAETQYPKKEKYTGLWSEIGKEVTFAKEWGNYKFTDEECLRLLNGETIQVKGISKKGKTYTVNGKLSILEYKGRKYVGFENLGFVDTFPEKFCGHKFTDEERKKLESGIPVHIEGCISKKTKRLFSTTVIYTTEGGKKVVKIKND